MKKVLKKIQILALAVALGLNSGCSDFLDTSSSVDTSDGDVLSNTAGLQKVLTSAYKQLYFNSQGADRVYAGLPGLQMYVDLGGSDVLCHTNMGGNQLTAYRYEPLKTQANGLSDAIWSMMYKIINQTNIIIDNIESAQGEQATKDAILGQAKAIRGICYFHLIQNYQQTYAIAKQKPGVILRLTSKDEQNLPRATVQATYDQIVKDLTDAKSLLGSYTREGKWFINQDVVTGHLARVYLVMNDWSKALAESTELYGKYPTLMSKEQYRAGFDDVISKNYPEVVWAVKFTDQNNLGGGTQFNFWYNQDASYGEGFTDGPIYSFLDFFADGKYEQLFEKTEDRYQFWKRTNNASAEWSTKWAYDKYKHYGDGNGAKQSNTRPEISLMRSAEMLLIMAEASAQLNNGQGLTHLNKLQKARGVKNLTSVASGTNLLEAIYVERRKELLCEGVTGLYDLLRLQKPLVRYQETASYKEGHYTWGVSYLNGYVANSANPTGTFPSNDYRLLCQIPQLEIVNNEALTESDQNPYSGTK
ncbi:RagB/SusD family nutrient uptake outer membrane protein [Sphingobacterium cellulitidis]|uniref:RagB/SusD family nutrient uptake outer membrane protein n=1 Tax=Sphingobacterium cellulitidis TaxID=1768011 RepID=UPI000B93EAC6|nr:RagB/SusD family nutrient uptake outer membrane protein [Sphingobacterium cellulitidis]